MATIDPSKLTPEYLKSFADEQIEAYLSTGPVEESQAEIYAQGAYKAANRKVPKVVWHDSPTAFARVRASVGASVWASVGASVWASVWASVGASVGDSVWASVWASVGASVGDSVWDSVRDSVGAWVWDSVWASVGDSVRDSVGAWVGAWYDSSDLSFYKFFDENLEKNNLESLCLLSEMVNGYYFTADVCYLIRKPIRLVRNNAGRLHWDHGKAIEWCDGTGFFYLHGVEFDEATYWKIVNQELTIKDMPTIKNADQRAVALSMLKPELLIKQMKAELIHTGVKGTKLYKTDNAFDTENTEYFMVMEHPSIKKRYFLEWVEPEVGKLGDADLAQASAWKDEHGNPMPVEDYLNSVNA